MTERLERVLTELEAIFKFTDGFSYDLDEGELYIIVYNEIYVSYLEEVIKVLTFYGFNPYKLIANSKKEIIIACSDLSYEWRD